MLYEVITHMFQQGALKCLRSGQVFLGFCFLGDILDEEKDGDDFAVRQHPHRDALERTEAVV